MVVLLQVLQLPLKPTGASSSCFLLSRSWVDPQIAHAVVLGNLPLCVRLPYRVCDLGQVLPRIGRDNISDTKEGDE